jgi:hypothetical protein
MPWRNLYRHGAQTRVCSFETRQRISNECKNCNAKLFWGERRKFINAGWLKQFAGKTPGGNS